MSWKVDALDSEGPIEPEADGTFSFAFTTTGYSEPIEIRKHTESFLIPTMTCFRNFCSSTNFFGLSERRLKLNPKTTRESSECTQRLRYPFKFVRANNIPRDFR